MAKELRQFQMANPTDGTNAVSPLIRLEPIDSIQRIVTDRFENPRNDNVETALDRRSLLHPQQLWLPTTRFLGLLAM